MMETQLTRQHYLSGIEPRWCAGCGDHGIFKAVTKAFLDLAIPREKLVVVSGIGCSSRFPYYVGSYGFHGIHGRAPAIAMGVKLANPSLSVWMVTGDGDALSIGGNHFLHLMRRNPDIKVLLLNNRVYGLTKGQLSPTSPRGMKTKTSPFGSIEDPVHPLCLAIAAGATFVARVPDTDSTLMSEVLGEAHRHKGIALIEILQNCPIFYDGAWEPISRKAEMPVSTIRLKHGEPILFGREKEKGLRAIGFDLEIASAADKSAILVHDAGNAGLAYKLASLDYPRFPCPVGILRRVEEPVYETSLAEQEKTAIERSGKGQLEKLLRSGETWEVK